MLNIIEPKQDVDFILNPFKNFWYYLFPVLSIALLKTKNTPKYRGKRKFKAKYIQLKIKFTRPSVFSGYFNIFIFH